MYITKHFLISGSSETSLSVPTGAQFNVPAKVKVVHEFTTARNLKELRGFLRLINYFTKFTNEHAQGNVTFKQAVVLTNQRQ